LVDINPGILSAIKFIVIHALVIQIFNMPSFPRRRESRRPIYLGLLVCLPDRCLFFCPGNAHGLFHVSETPYRLACHFSGLTLMLIISPFHIGSFISQANESRGRGNEDMRAPSESLPLNGSCHSMARYLLIGVATRQSSQ
jgi:hypothetical protein